MKKLLAILLALLAVGAFAFADDAPTMGVAAYAGGTWGVYGNSVGDYAVGRNLLDVDFDISGKVLGISAEIEYSNPDLGGFGAGSMYMSYAYGFAKFFDGKLQVNGGAVSEVYRTTNAAGSYIIGAAIGGDGLGIVAKPVEGLTIATYTPFTGNISWATSAVTYAGSSGLDALWSSDFIVKYSIAKIADLYAWGNLAAETYKFGAVVTAVPGLTLKAAFNDVATVLSVNLNGSGKIADLVTVAQDVNLYLNTTFGWASYTAVSIRPAAVKYQLGVSVNNGGATAVNYIKYNVNPSITFYEGTNTIGAGVRFDSDTSAAPATTWRGYVSYSIYM